MSSGDGLMISGMGGTIPLIAMRGGAADTSGNSVTPSVNSVTPSVNSVTPSVNSVTPSVNSVTPSVNSVTPSVNSVTPSVNSVTVITPSGDNIDPSKITWEGTEYGISQTKEEWDEDDKDNFLNYLGIPKVVFTSDEEYTAFIEGIQTCLADSSSVDGKCDSVNNILRRVIELRIKELVEQERYGNVQKVMNEISYKEDGTNPEESSVEESGTPE